MKGETAKGGRLTSFEPLAGMVKVETKSMAVLLDLARHAGEVRTREELLDAVWTDLVVSEEVVSHCVWARVPHHRIYSTVCYAP